MMLTVRPAKSGEHTFAWPMYRSYITDHIFRKHTFAKAEHDWISDEEAKFQTAWQHGEPYIIEIDGSSVGWLSISKVNNRITVQNVFLDDAQQDKGISERIFREMIPEWRAAKRVVDVPVHMHGPLAAKIETTLTHLGFSPTGDDGLVKHMTANWSK